jgi:hypothetical protein
MALTDKLRSLDQRVLPGTREAEEDAETYLRRVAASRAISPAQAGDVMVALREHLGVLPEDSDDDSDDSEGSEGSEESDEAEGGASDEADEADDADDADDADEKEKSDDED